MTIYVGEDGGEELANELAQALAEKYEDVEVEIHQGGQPSTITCLSVRTIEQRGWDKVLASQLFWIVEQDAVVEWALLR